MKFNKNFHFCKAEFVRRNLNNYTINFTNECQSEQLTSEGFIDIESKSRLIYILIQW